MEFLHLWNTYYLSHFATEFCFLFTYKNFIILRLFKAQAYISLCNLEFYGEQTFKICDFIIFWFSYNSFWSCSPLLLRPLTLSKFSPTFNSSQLIDFFWINFGVLFVLAIYYGWGIDLPGARDFKKHSPSLELLNVHSSPVSGGNGKLLYQSFWNLIEIMDRQAQSPCEFMSSELSFPEDTVSCGPPRSIALQSSFPLLQ